MDFMLSEETATSALNKLQEHIKPKSSQGNLYYRWRTMGYGQTCTVRFLPVSMLVADNQVQPAFWTDRKLIRLRFDDPVTDGGVVILRIPVMQMYKGGRADDDLILKQVTVVYDEADRLKKMGKKEESEQVRAKASYHWHRGEGLAQCFVVKSPFIEQDIPENPIRLIELPKQLLNVIKAEINPDADPEVKLESWPCHGRRGCNFIIKKSQSGEYPKYDAGSGFSRHPSPWTEEQTAALDHYGLFDLEQFLPARPTDDEYKVLSDIVAQSLKGNRVWDSDWEEHLVNVKPYRTSRDGRSSEDNETEDLQASVRENIARMSGTTTDTAQVISSLTRGRTEPEVEPKIEADTVNEPETEETEVKTADDVKSIVEKIRRNTAGKTATA